MYDVIWDQKVNFGFFSRNDAPGYSRNVADMAHIRYKSQFFGRGMFGKIVRVPIFWTWPVWRKREIPNFLVINRVPILGNPVYWKSLPLLEFYKFQMLGWRLCRYHFGRSKFWLDIDRDRMAVWVIFYDV